MLHDGDAIVLFLLVGWIFFLLLRGAKRRSIHPMVVEEGKPVRGEIPDLLEREGYQVVAAKQRLPVSVRVGDQLFESRLYADYIARQHGDYYVVAVARPRKTLRMSGAAIRDQFLAHLLAFQAAGVLYVDPQHGSVRRILLDVAGIRMPRRRRLVSHLVFLGLGALIAVLIK